MNQTNAQDKAQPKTYSLYEDQLSWVRAEAERQSKRTGRTVNPSKIIQQLIDDAKKKGNTNGRRTEDR